jgi:Fe-S-cluster containining protein
MHLERLVDALLADPAVALGDARFAGALDRDDALAITAKLADAVDQGVAARAEKAEAAGLHVACRAGCATCCEQPILVWMPEALRVAEWLARPENAAVRAGFIARVKDWRDRVGDSLSRVAEAAARQDPAAHVEAHLNAWRRRVMCAFNEGGLCTIYEVRPIICRTHHALDSAERCGVDPPGGRTPSTLAFVPLDRFVSRAKQVHSAMHHTLGGSKLRLVALCEAVAALTAP